MGLESRDLKSHRRKLPCVTGPAGAKRLESQDPRLTTELRFPRRRGISKIVSDKRGGYANWLAACLEYRCPLRGCGFESRALRYRSPNRCPLSMADATGGLAETDSPVPTDWRGSLRRSADSNTCAVGGPFPVLDSFSSGMWDYLPELLLLAVAEVSLTVAVTIHAVLWKRDSRAVIAWVGLAWLAPFVGAIAYFCFGVNRIQRKAVSLNVRDAWERASRVKLTPDELRRRESLKIEHPNLVGLATLGRKLSERPVVPGNLIEPLINGDEAYPVMLGAIDHSQESVSLLSYIFDSDRVGNMFAKSLIAAWRRGVRVRVLIDDVGSKYSDTNMVRQLRSAGVPAASFLPTRVPRLPTYANLRNHRKILVVDGRVGFTGGTNIREGHWLSMRPDSPVECLHFRLEGPIVAHLQEAFASDWAFATGESLLGESWFPALQRAGEVWCRGIEHGPDADFEKMSDLIVGALSSARERVRIVTPYFLPTPSLIQLLNVTAMRGVDVEILLPARNNILLVQWATTAQLWQLLEKGCRVLFSPPPFDHTKLLIVDDIWTLIGSTNWDPRSLRLNFEFNVECYDSQLAASVNRIVDEKSAAARVVTAEEMGQRSLPIRLRDGLARLASPYL